MSFISINRILFKNSAFSSFSYPSSLLFGF
jgi:hypothetical protein